MPDPSHSLDDPYRPPPHDHAARASRPVPRVYGVLSMIFAALMLALVVITLVVDMQMYGGLATTREPALPPPQEALKEELAAGVAGSDARGQTFIWIHRVVYSSTSLALLVLGLGQLRRRRWAARLTPVWSVVALGGLVLVSVAGVVLDGSSIAAALPALALLGPYPVLLLAVFARAGTGAGGAGTGAGTGPGPGAETGAER